MSENLIRYGAIIGLTMSLALPELAIAHQTEAIDYVEIVRVQERFGSRIGRLGAGVFFREGAQRPTLVYTGTVSDFGGSNFWSLVSFDSDSQAYELEFVSPVATDPISAIAVREVSPDVSAILYIAHESGFFESINVETQQPLASVDLDSQSVQKIRFGDADNDGLMDILLRSPDRLFVLDPDSLTVLHSLQISSIDVDVGNVDADPAIEIVIANRLSSSVIEFDGANITTQWLGPPSGFGDVVELANVNATPWMEIVAAARFNDLWLYDAESEQQIWTLNASAEIGLLRVRDINNDSVPDVIYGSRQSGSLRAFDAETSAQSMGLFTIGESGIDSVLFVDGDDDGRIELFIGAGGNSTGEDRLNVYDLLTLDLEFESEHIDGPFASSMLADTDGDGVSDLVVVPEQSDALAEVGGLSVFNVGNGKRRLRLTAEDFSTSDWRFANLAFGDPDNDGNQEFVISARGSSQGTLFVVSLNGQMEYSLPFGGHQVLVSDVDADDQQELVIRDDDELMIVDGATGALEWAVSDLGIVFGNQGFDIGNVDQDPALEIVVARDFLYVVDGVTKAVTQSPNIGYKSIDLVDVDGDGVEEIISTRLKGTIITVDGETFEESPPAFGCFEPIESIAVYKAGLSSVVFHDCGDRMVARRLGNPQPLWVSDIESESVTTQNNLRVETLNGVGHRIVLPLATGVAVFESNSDGDAIADASDNCQLVANTNQIDSDDDGFGDVCDADFNNDGIVNVLDLGLLRTEFFGANPVYDLNQDGTVNVVDLSLFRALFFQSPGPSGRVQ